MVPVSCGKEKQRALIRRSWVYNCKNVNEFPDNCYELRKTNEMVVGQQDNVV